MTRRARFVYRTLLRVLPRQFLHEHGDALEEALCDRMERAKGRAFGYPLVWLAVVGDLVRAAPSVWIRALRSRRRDSHTPPRGRNEMLETMLNDLRLGLRSLARTPGPTAVVIVTLTLGIGANTAVFSVVNGIVLRPLDLPDSDQVYLVDAVWKARSEDPVPHVGGNFQFLEREAEVFQSLGAMMDVRQNLTGSNGAEQITVVWASRGVFEVTGVTPVLGRGFLDTDSPNTALLSYGLWQSYFGGDQAVLGQSVMLDSRPATVVGVLPPAFNIDLPPTYQWPARVDLWRLPDPDWSNGDMWNMQELSAAAFRVIGRVGPGVTKAQLDDELEAIAAELRNTYQRHADANFQLVARPLHGAVVGEVGPVLWALLGAVVLVLLIACANVTNIMLVRSESRRRELAVRSALGASRVRIVMMLMTESAVLSIAAALGGIGLAYVGLDALIAMSPANLPRTEAVTIDTTVLLFATGASIACTFLFGLVPAFRGSEANPNLVLQTGARGAAHRATATSRLLVVTEVALSFALLTGAGLLLRTFSALEDIRPEFDHHNLLTFSASIPGTDYAAPLQTHQFFDELLRSSETVPGVRFAAVVWPLPLEGQTWTGSYATSEDDRTVTTSANYRVISAGYFETLNTRFLEGRTFRAQDQRNVAIVSRALADQAWPGEPVVGKRIRAAPWGQMVWYDVIGMADDIRYADIRKDASPTIYFATQGWSWADWEFGVVARTDADPMSVVPGIKARLAALDANVPLARPRAMQGYVADLLSPNAFALTLFALFAMLAGVMATLGVYAVLSHTVSQRTRELGIRVALGARRHGVARLVVGQGIRLTLLGVAGGLLSAIWLSRFVAGMLYGVTPTDPVTYAAIAVGVVLVGTLASYLPARRAASVDPAEALRQE